MEPYSTLGSYSEGDGTPVSIDHKMTWLRRHGVIIFKNRGDIGPQKLYLNPNNPESMKDSWKFQRRVRHLLVDQVFNFSGVEIDVYPHSITYEWDDRYYIRVARDTLDAADAGNTDGIINRYDFEYPVWFNVVVYKQKLPTKVIARNCVVDWYELHNYINHTGPIGVDANIDALGPLEALRRVRPEIKLFTNGPLFGDDIETEVAYLAELGT